MGNTAPVSLSRSSAPEPDLRSQIEALEQRFVALRDHARQMQRLASLGTAAAALAHEFNNLMTPVVGYAKYALDADDVALMKKALDLTLKQTAIGTAMAERILGLAMDEAQSFQSVSIGQCAADAVACLCRDLSKDGIQLQVDVAPALTVWSDPKQLQQVLFNLLINARQAMSGHSGLVRISARPVEPDRVAIEVGDTGPGIPPEILPHIFEPFFSTKKAGRDRERSGSGLGLAICHDIVEEQRGQLTVQSEVGNGTTFIITLPSSR